MTGWGPDEADRVIDALAATTGVTIDREWRAGVAYFLSVAHGHTDRLRLAPVEAGTLDLAPSFDPTVRRSTGVDR